MTGGRIELAEEKFDELIANASRSVFETDDEMRKGLREPFPKEQIGKLPKTAKRPALDFVSHGYVTDRLNDIEPGWTYTIDEQFTHGNAFWVRGTITIGGVSRAEYGDGDDPKDAIGNFIRRGAMRFGVALDLWLREGPAAPPTEQASPRTAPNTGTSEPGGAESSGEVGAQDHGEGSEVSTSSDDLEAFDETWTVALDLGITVRDALQATGHTKRSQVTERELRALMEARKAAV